ncbi:hypothetical protein [Brevundimonas sp.]|uniref:hypothetical protein n=1 Tax=Brevundimonas sp. TaxID=1871086 RepID=UPI003D116570
MLDRLALDRLKVEAERVRAEEGWSWAETHLDYPHDHGLARAYPRAPEHDEEATARLAVLSEDYDALIEALPPDEAIPEDMETRLNVIEAELRDAHAPVYDPETVARSGLFALLDRDGGVRIERGFQRPEDMAEVEDSEDDDSSENGPGTKGPKSIPDRLVMELTAHRTAALRDLLGSRPEDAFLAALHAVVLPTYWTGERRSCLNLKLESRDVSNLIENWVETPAARSLEARHASWAARLPEDPADLWAALVAFKPKERMGLFAHCVSLSIEAVLPSAAWRRDVGAETLAAHLALDMGRYWSATPEQYFGRVSKTHILEVVEAEKPEAVVRLNGLKKDAMARHASDLLAPEGWLPPLLKREP